VRLESYRADFPVTQRFVYFNHAAAAVAPISLQTALAMHKVVDDVACLGAHHWPHWYSSIERVRVRAAPLSGASPEEIAFVKNTSEAIALAANGLELGGGDKVVSVNGEFPGNIYPWMKLKRFVWNWIWWNKKMDSLTFGGGRHEIRKRSNLNRKRRRFLPRVNLIA